MSDRVLVKMTPAERDLWVAFKTVLKEQAGRTPTTLIAPGRPTVEVTPIRHEEPSPGLVAAAVEQGYCGVAGRVDTVCLRDSGHARRHRYRPVSEIPGRHRAPDRP